MKYGTVMDTRFCNTCMCRWVSIVKILHYMAMSFDELIIFYVAIQGESYGQKLGYPTMTPELQLVTSEIFEADFNSDTVEVNEE